MHIDRHTIGTRHRIDKAGRRTHATRSAVGRWPLVALVIALLLASCGAAPGETTTRTKESGIGGLSAQDVTLSFFEDLAAALKDPGLAHDDTRSAWVDRLSGYFAPSERDDQRATIRAALDSFADGLGQLTPDQTLTLDLHFEGVEKLSDDGERALVRPVNASIHLLIGHTTDRGLVTDFNQTIGLDKIIGRPDGAIPAIRIGDRWFLTEG